MVTSTASLSEAKGALRQRIKTRLAQVPATETERQSNEVTAKVIALPEFQHSKRICVYLSMPRGEIATTGMIKWALSQQKKIFVPHIISGSKHQGKTMEMFALTSLEDMESLKPDSWGIPSLSATSLSERENAFGGWGPYCEGKEGDVDAFEGLDLILLPGMAFDSSGGRLGHGKGFYDRFLNRYQGLLSQKSYEAKFPHLAGLALQQQLLQEQDGQIPMSTSDWRIDQVITSS